jgi:hypothetical protein
VCWPSDGNGQYAQSIDASSLSEGYHYLTVRAFRHRTDGGPAVYQDFKEILYVDRLKPVSSVSTFKPFGAGTGDNDIWLRSDDQTADGMHVFLNLPANLTDAQIMSMVNAGQGKTDKIDRDVFKTGFFGVPNGNNVATVVTFEITGNSNIQRYTGVKPGNVRGAGLGDLNFDGLIAQDDISGTSYGFEHYLYARDNDFNPAADTNADGRIDTRDLFQLQSHLKNSAAPANVSNILHTIALNRTNFNGQFGTDAYDIHTLYSRRGKSGDVWSEDLNVDGKVDQLDVDAFVRQVFESEYGDFNLDRRIDAADLQTLASNWQQSGKAWALADATGDTLVNQADLDLLKLYWGFGVSQPESIYDAANRIGFTAVPEPTSLATLALAGGLLLRRRKRTNLSFKDSVS